MSADATAAGTRPETAAAGTAGPRTNRAGARGPVARAGRGLGARLAARAGGGVVRIVLLVVALFWLLPTIGLLLSSLRTRPTSRPAAGGRSSPRRRS